MNNYINIHYKIHRLYKYTYIHPTNTFKKNIEPQESLFFNPGHFKVPAISLYTLSRPSKKKIDRTGFPSLAFGGSQCWLRC